MKKITAVIIALLFLFCLIPTAYAAEGTVYYIDSAGGDDSLDGRSEVTAWKSVENLRDLQLTGGDKVLFRCGCTFTVEELTLTGLSGTEEKPILISSYGEGSKPLLTTNEYKDIMWLIDCSYVTIDNLEMTAPNGGGIWINTANKKSDGITLSYLTIHNVQNYENNRRDDIFNGPKEARACIMIKGLISFSPYTVDNLTITGCELYDCGNGISLWGGYSEETWPGVWTESTPVDEIEFYFNRDALIENCYFHDMDAEALIVGICENALVTNCRVIDCAQNDGLDEDGNMTHVNAAIWFWGSQHSTIEYTEIAGQKCVGDGMAVDFDSRSNYCTYQYIYSHDNMRFLRCCAPLCGQKGNTVRYCLSVNDNQGQNRFGTSSSQETDFSFYNNTIINSQSFVMDGVNNGFIANNIFVGDISKNFTPYKNVRSEDGTVTKYKFTGTFTNNCVYGMSAPLCAENTLTCNPCFTGNDESDPMSWRLSENSPLLGAGVKIDGGGTDIFGNGISGTQNIGCYAGEGEKEKAPDDVLSGIRAFFGTVLGRAYQVIYEFIIKTFAF